METGKILDKLNIPAAVVHSNGHLNVFHITGAMYESFGIRDEKPSQQTQEFVAKSLLGDETCVKIPMDGGKTLLVPEAFSNIAALHECSMHDELTRAYNRRGLETQYQRMVGRVGSEGVTVVLYLDANKFKELNDTHGHAVGDKVLVAMTQRLRRELKSEDLVARLGGDEFVALVWMPNQDTVDQFLAARLSQINAVVCRDYAIDDGRVVLPTTFALGVHVHEGALPALKELLDAADVAMYADKVAARA